LGSVKERDNSVDLGVDGRKKLKLIVRIQGLRVWTEIRTDVRLL
jgi:hypothetical protein